MANKSADFKGFSTDLEIKALPLVGAKDEKSGQVIKEKPYKVFDTCADSKGLYLYVQKGCKVFRYDYVFSGIHKTLTIGKFGEVFTLKQARDKLKEAKGLIAAGHDPAKDKQEKKVEAKKNSEEALKAKQVAENTFSKVNSEWFAVWCQGKADATVYKTELIIQKNLLPKLGAIPIAKITQNDLLSVIRQLEADKVYAVRDKALSILKLFHYQHI